jgi:hypothetical protein
MQITFIATGPADLEAQLRQWLGISAAAPVAPAPAAKPAGRPLPAWAPAGSTWVELPGAPQLRGPDGLPITVRWEGSTPVRA